MAKVYRNKGYEEKAKELEQEGVIADFASDAAEPYIRIRYRLDQMDIPALEQRLTALSSEKKQPMSRLDSALLAWEITEIRRRLPKI